MSPTKSQSQSQNPQDTSGAPVPFLHLFFVVTITVQEAQDLLEPKGAFLSLVRGGRHFIHTPSSLQDILENVKSKKQLICTLFIHLCDGRSKCVGLGSRRPDIGCCGTPIGLLPYFGQVFRMGSLPPE